VTSAQNITVAEAVVVPDAELPATSLTVDAGVNENAPDDVVDVTDEHEPPHAPVTVNLTVWLLLLSAKVPVYVTVRVPMPLER
jgi:hypothetical protein